MFICSGDQGEFIQQYAGTVMAIYDIYIVAEKYTTNAYNIQFQSQRWTHLLIQGFFFVCTIFYIGNNSEDIKTMKLVESMPRVCIKKERHSTN